MAFEAYLKHTPFRCVLQVKFLLAKFKYFEEGIMIIEMPWCGIAQN